MRTVPPRYIADWVDRLETPPGWEGARRLRLLFERSTPEAHDGRVDILWNNKGAYVLCVGDDGLTIVSKKTPSIWSAVRAVAALFAVDISAILDPAIEAGLLSSTELNAIIYGDAADLA